MCMEQENEELQGPTTSEISMEAVRVINYEIELDWWDEDMLYEWSTV